MLRWKAAQYPHTDELIAANPLTNYSERDLFFMAGQAGFVDTHLELHLDLLPSLAATWETFVKTSPYPQAPSLEQVMSMHFSAEERRFFEEQLRPMIEGGKALSVERLAFLCARKPRS
jgi:hypothetical protein